MKEKLIVFVRAPELGKVKTRLAKAIGDRRALAAYKEMLGRLFGNLRYIACLQDPLAERRSPNRRGSRGNQCAGSETGAPSRRSLPPAANPVAVAHVELRFTPDDAGASVSAWLHPGWQLKPQGAGDLGEKLKRSFDESFQEGFERVVIIGSDAPEVTRKDIESAWHYLRDHDVVLGPAKDGGYWLIGLRGPQPSLFEGIPWSSSAVLEQTVLRVRAAGLTGHFLRTLADIDTEEDWRQFVAQ
jgi:rSAM/selenodomain-associated transferase 1